MASGSDMKQLKNAAVVIVGLAVVVLIGIAILTQLKTSALVLNATADLFIAGLTYFGTFLGVVVIGMIGKILVSMFSKS